MLHAQPVRPRRNAFDVKAPAFIRRDDEGTGVDLDASAGQRPETNAVEDRPDSVCGCTCRSALRWLLRLGGIDRNRRNED